MKIKDTICIGIDPGYGRVGWAVGHISGSKVSILAYDCIETDPDLDHFDRYRQIDTTLTTVLNTHTPTEAALESLFFYKNKTTAMAVSEARGVIISCFLRHGMSISEYTPAQIKVAVTGSGAADKTAVEKMVQLQTNLPDLSQAKDDAVDAVAVVLTHAQSRTVAASTKHAKKTTFQQASGKHQANPKLAAAIAQAKSK